MNRTRLNLFMQPDHARRLDDLAAHRGVSKSSIVAAALAAFLAPDGGDPRGAVVTRRLDRLSRQIEALDRDQTILIETVALYVRYVLTVTPALPESHQAAARATGKLRFTQFVDQLARHLQSGRRSEGRRAGKQCVSRCSARRSPNTYRQKTQHD